MNVREQIELCGATLHNGRATTDWNKANEIATALGGKPLPGQSDKPVNIIVKPPKDDALIVGFQIRTTRHIEGWADNSKYQEYTIAIPLPPAPPGQHFYSITNPSHLMARAVRELFVDGNDKGTLMYAVGTFWEWNGRYWEEKDFDTIHDRVWKFIERIFNDHNQRSDNEAKISSGLVHDVMNSLKANLATTAKPFEWLNGDTRKTDHWMFCRNAVIDLDGYCDNKPDCIFPHDRNLFVTSVMPFDFDFNAPEPKRFNQFKNELWPNDPASQDLLEEMFADMLTQKRRYHFFVCCGASRGGKSTIARLQAAIIGEANVAALELHKLGDRFALENALHKPLIQISETRWPNEDSSAMDVLCSLTGGDVIRVDRKNKQAVSENNFGMIVVVSNPIPSVKDDSGRFRNRLNLLRFTRSFAGKEDETLGEQLASEIPGIVLQIISAWKRLRDNRGKFTKPELSQQIVEIVSTDGSPIQEWGDEKCLFPKPGELFESFKADKQELFDSYRAWCREHLIDAPANQAAFTSQLLNAYPSLKSKRLRVNKDRFYVVEGIALDTVTKKQTKGQAA